MTADTGLQTLTEHKGLLKPQYTNNEELVLLKFQNADNKEGN